jgi:hypothetical protein
MTNLVSDGLSLAQATGQRVRDGVGAVATGIREEAGAVAHGIGDVIDAAAQHGEPAAHKREPSAWRMRSVELAASAAGALAAFFVSRLVRARLHHHGK